MADTTPNRRRARRRSLVLAGAAAAVFAAVALQLVLHGPLATRLDPAVSAWWAAHRSPGLSALMLAISAWHSTLGIEVMLATAVAVLAWRRRWRDALWIAIAVESSMLLNVGLKHAFARVRPVVDAPLVHLETFSFPSGHALASTVLWGCLLLLLPAPRRRAGGVAVALLVALVAFSRVVLGAHYLSDVLAGIGEGVACVAAWGVLRPRGPRRLAPAGCAARTQAGSCDTARHNLPES